MERKNNIPLNPYFYVPFMCWVLGGGVLYSVYGKEFLFRNINARHTDLLDTVMACITMMGEAYIIVPALLLPMLLRRYRSWEYLLLAATANTLPMIVQQVLKSYFERPRPLNYFQNAAWIHRLPDWPELYERSFPSGHSEGAFSFFCFMALLLPARYKWVGALFLILALSVCYSRVYLAAHFFEDTYTGSIIGVVVPTLCFITLRRYLPKLKVAGGQ